MPTTVRHAPRPGRYRAATAVAAAGLAVALAACGSTPSATGAGHRGTGHHRAGNTSTQRRSGQPTTTTTTARTATATTGTGSGTTTTTAPAPSTTTTTTAPAAAHGPLTSPPLPAPGPGFVAGRVTAVGDSVMLDYQTALQQHVPGIDVQATVSRQWTTGETVLQQDKSAGQLGAVVVVGLGTNGPLTTADVDSMLSVLSGASRVVLVNVYVDRPWQDPNNALLTAAVARYPNVVVADWHTLASQNPGWLYSTGTHLPIGGPGAQALAALVASKV